MRKKGSEFEDYVEEVYRLLLSKENIITIDKRKFFRNISTGFRYEADVYFEFELIGILHRVVIECKNYKDPIPRSEVEKFVHKLDKLKNLRLVGIIISKSGFSQNALTLSQEEGIKTLTFKDLESMKNIFYIKDLIERLESHCLPDENSIGEPFLGLMEKSTSSKNQVTGNVFMHNDYSGNMFMPLFFSKKQALQYQSEMKLDNVCVRGLTQNVLKLFLIYSKRFNAYFGLLDNNRYILNNEFQFIKKTLDELKKEFFHRYLDLNDVKPINNS